MIILVVILYQSTNIDSGYYEQVVVRCSNKAPGVIMVTSKALSLLLRSSKLFSQSRINCFLYFIDSTCVNVCWSNSQSVILSSHMCAIVNKSLLLRTHRRGHR